MSAGNGCALQQGPLGLCDLHCILYSVFNSVFYDRNTKIFQNKHYVALATKGYNRNKKIVFLPSNSQRKIPTMSLQQTVKDRLFLE